MKRIPDMIFVVDPKKERICIQEAQSLGIKLVGIADNSSDSIVVTRDYIIKLLWITVCISDTNKLNSK